MQIRSGRLSTEALASTVVEAAAKHIHKFGPEFADLMEAYQQSAYERTMERLRAYHGTGGGNEARAGG